MNIRNSLLFLVAAFFLTGCLAVVPMQLPPEGTTATTFLEGQEIIRSPDGAVTNVRDTSFRWETSVSNTPPQYRRNGPRRGQTILACNERGYVLNYLESGFTQPRQCRQLEATNARPHSSYRTEDGRCYDIMRFMSSGLWYYTAVQIGYCPRWTRR